MIKLLYEEYAGLWKVFENLVMYCKIACDDTIQFILGVVEPRPCLQGEPTWCKLHYNDINGFNWGKLILKN